MLTKFGLRNEYQFNEEICSSDNQPYLSENNNGFLAVTHGTGHSTTKLSELSSNKSESNGEVHGVERNHFVLEKDCIVI